MYVVCMYCVHAWRTCAVFMYVRVLCYVVVFVCCMYMYCVISMYVGA